MANDLPDGYTVDQAPSAPSGGELPAGYKLDDLPSGYTVDEPQQGQSAGTGTAFTEGANSMVPFGNRITSGIGAALYANQMAKTPSEIPQYLKEGYNQAQLNEQATKAAHGTAYGLGEATGLVGTLPLIPTGYNFIKGAPLAQDASVLAKFGNTIGQSARSAAVAAPIGAAYGASGAKDVSDMPQEAVHGAQTSAEIAGALPFVGPAAGLLGKGVAAATPDIIKAAASKAMTPIEQHASNFWLDKVTPVQAKFVSNLKYNEAEKAGGVLSPEKRNEFIDAAQGARKGDDGSIVPPSPLAQKILDNLEGTRGQPLTLRGAQNIEQDINANISYQQNGMLTPESVQLLKIKKALRSTIDGANQNDMVGGAEGWNAWRDAKKAYSAVGILTDMNNMISKATYAEQPGSQLKRQLARWSLKPGSTSGLNPEEMDLVKDSINNNFKDELLRTAGSRLTSIGAAVSGLTGHGVLGAIGAPALGQAGRNAAFANQLQKMAPLVKAVGERLPGNLEGFYEKYEDMAPQRLLPPPEKMSYIPMTESEVAHARAVNDALGRRGSETPQTGGPLRPQVNEQGTLTNPLQGAPIDPDIMSGMEELPTPQGAHENPLLNNPYWAPKKRDGGKVGFNLKKFKK